MLDSEFKALDHPVGDFVVASRGTTVAVGYKPDVTVRDEEDKLRFILESEQKTDRKAFLGALVKAEMYAEEQGANPELLIVMQPASNTTTQQIANHLRPYKEWLARIKGGNLSLAVIHVLSDNDYKIAASAGDVLGSHAFKLRGHVL
ncbi:hypothetical protein WJ01_01175 [Burkholderia vietnamiensis]|uniref:hypothetical protein n=1 Tax=Burkholderia vietnamiensis TaxID=60552 RepID=UPI00075D79EB|nr:hypothetical protein [Burkholderia vietnamiensis]KVE90626.1 hypothetical protein WJ01_01175 [Burkholderia vietnamiensis]